MKLHLGVLDVPYADGKATTGDVATILEHNYNVMGVFVEEVGADAISAAFEQAAQDAIADLLSGAPAASLNLTLAATGEIEDAFRIFIDQKEMDGVVPGVPTAASLKGVNHRLKRPYTKSNPVRPSFRDTGLYEASFKAWTED